VAEFLPGYEATNWHGVGAPKGTPPKSLVSSTEKSNLALADPRSRRGLPILESGIRCSAADFGKLIVEDTEKWPR